MSVDANGRVGVLRVVGTPIGNLGDLSPRGRAALEQADLVACEDTRRTGRLYSALGIASPRFVVVNDHTEADALDGLVRAAQAGRDVVLVSDAGMPAVSDPGARVVDAARRAGVPVEVVPGPSAVLTALVSAGFVADRFCFEGFLPRKGAARSQRIAALASEQRVAVLFEAPHRVRRLADDLLAVLGPSRVVAVCRELTKLHEETWRGGLGDAVEHLAEREPRGEYVLVVEGASELPVEDDRLREALAATLASGGSRRDAVDEVAATFGVARRRVYELALDEGGA